MTGVMNTLPVVVIGAGPVGLAAAAHLLERGLEPLVLEAGPVPPIVSASGVTSGSSPPGASSSMRQRLACLPLSGGLLVPAAIRPERSGSPPTCVPWPARSASAFATAAW